MILRNMGTLNVVGLDMFESATHLMPYYSKLEKKKKPVHPESIDLCRLWLLNSVIDREVYHVQLCEHWRSTVR